MDSTVILALLHILFVSMAVEWRSAAEIICNATPVGQNYTGKVCIARGRAYPVDIFQQLATCYCYRYTNPVLLRSEQERTVISSTCKNVTSNYYFPCIKYKDNSSTVPYDSKNAATVRAMRNAFKDDVGLQKWLRCSEAAASCCDSMDTDGVQPGVGYCPATWDGWYCWGIAPENTYQQGACPEYVYVDAPPTCDQHSVRHCKKNGRWNETTNYGECSSNPISMMRGRLNYHVAMLSVSIAICTPAFVIFCTYRKLQVTRVTLHRNLVLAIIVRNIFSIAVKKAVVLSSLGVSSEAGNVMQQNPAWCRALSFLDRLCGSAVYSCMLLEGVFLHRIIAAAFRGEPDMRLYSIIAAGWAVVPVIAWTVVRTLYDNENCWAVAHGEFPWIFDGPRIFAMCVNSVLMLDIVRVLLTKMRKVNNNKSVHIRRMTRATIFLIPLFGVQFLLTSYRPKTRNCNYEQLYYYIFYTMDGLQGAIVALLYCYLNREVQVQLVKTYQRVMVRVFQYFGRSYVPGPRPTWQYSEHRSTATSLVYDDKPRLSMISHSVCEDGPLTTASRPSIVSFSDGEPPRPSIGAPRRSILATKLRKVSSVMEESSTPVIPATSVINGINAAPLSKSEERVTFMDEVYPHVQSTMDIPEVVNSIQNEDEMDGFFTLDELPVCPEKEEQDSDITPRKESRKSSRQREKISQRFSDTFGPRVSDLFRSLSLSQEESNSRKLSHKASKQQRHRGSLPSINDLFMDNDASKYDDNLHNLSWKSKQQKHRGSLPGIIDLFKGQDLQEDENVTKLSRKTSKPHKPRRSLPRISDLFSSQNLTQEHQPQRSYTQEKHRISTPRLSGLIKTKDSPEEASMRKFSKNPFSSTSRVSDLSRSQKLSPSERSGKDEVGPRRLSDFLRRNRLQYGETNEIQKHIQSSEAGVSDAQNRSLSVSLRGLANLLHSQQRETAVINPVPSIAPENVLNSDRTLREAGEESTI